MKKFVSLFLSIAALGFVVASCSSSNKSIEVSEEEKSVFADSEQDTVKIASSEVEYEIYIIEPGFYNWLDRIARPEGYYSQHFMENRNELFVLEWNRRVINPTQYDPQLYMWEINYDRQIDYGYDVNYKLYNYLIYIQRKYNQRLGPYVPRI